MRYLVTNRADHFLRLELHDNFISTEESLEIIKPVSVIGADMETRGMTPFLYDATSLQLGTGEHEIIYDLEPSHQNLWKPVDLSPIKEKMEDPETRYVGHNFLFDQVFLLQKYGIRTRRIFDTLLADRVITNGIKFIGGRLWERNLAACEKNWLGATQKNKDVREDVIKYGLNTPHTLDYAFRDVDADYLRLFKALEKKLIDQGSIAAAGLEFQFSAVAAWMEVNGFYVNPDEWYAKARKNDMALMRAELALTKRLEEDHPDIYKTMFDINWASGPQVIQAFKAMGINTWDEKGEKDTIDKKFILKQAKKFPFIKDYIHVAEMQKEFGTYGYEWAEPTRALPHAPGDMGKKKKGHSFWKGFLMPDGRIHTKTNLLVDTGRISSGNIKMGPFPNLANVPSDAETRHCFQGQGQRTLVVCDYSGQETVILADLCRDKNLIHFLTKVQGDQHSWTASLCYPQYTYEQILAAKGKSDKGEEMTKEEIDMVTKRGEAKQAWFASTYGGNGYTISNNIGCSKEDGERIFAALMAAYPGMAAWFKSQERDAMQRGWIMVNPLTGRRRWLDGYQEWCERDRSFQAPGFWEDYRAEKKKNSKRYKEELKPLMSRHMGAKNGYKNKSLNSPCQGIGSEMTKYACVLLYDEILSRGWEKHVKLVNFVYDEIVVETVASKAEKVAEIVQHCMETASSKFLTLLEKIPATPVITKYWRH